MTQLVEFSLSDKAAKRITLLVDNSGNPSNALRVFVEGGGCSGFSYGFELDENISDEDYALSFDGGKVVIDSLSYQYLKGAALDYVQDLSGSRFLVTNPNAVQTCDCNSSFSPF